MVTSALTKNGPGVTRPARRLTFTPRVDVLETPDGLVLLLDVPGVKPGDVDVRFERGELVVHGRCEPAEPPAGACLAAEYETGDYYRAFIVSQDVDAAKIEAELKHGVLTVRLPKAEAARARSIPVQGG
jgi:HSP20 family molecular chaperone IbpA